MENSSIKVALSPQMGGAVVYLGKKGLNAKNGVACKAGDSFCKEQWIGNRFSDRGRQLQIDFRDQTASDQNSERMKPDPKDPTKKVPVVCGDFGMDPVGDPSNFLLDGGCGWNPTMAGAWQGPEGWKGKSVHLPGETGGCVVANGQISYCTDAALLGEGGPANLNTAALPSPKKNRVYARSGRYMNYNANYPTAPGDTAILRTDVWTEQWYCLRGDSLEMQVKLHHDGDDHHWNFGHGPHGPNNEIVSLWLQGGVDEFFYPDKDGKTTVLRDSQNTDPTDHFLTELGGNWYGLARDNVPRSVIVSVEIPDQLNIGDFGKTSAAYWGARGSHDKPYPTSAGSFEQEMNIEPHSEYYWNASVRFAKTKP
jgi:hypothetical protein